MDENKQRIPAPEPVENPDTARRQALRTLGKTALYTAPAVIATLISTEARAS